MFEEIADHATFAKRHPNVAKPPFDLPITSVEIDLAIPGLGLSLHTGGINASRMSGVVVGQNYIGVNIGRIPNLLRRSPRHRGRRSFVYKSTDHRGAAAYAPGGRQDILAPATRGHTGGTAGGIR